MSASADGSPSNVQTIWNNFNADSTFFLCTSSGPPPFILSIYPSTIHFFPSLLFNNFLPTSTSYLHSALKLPPHIFLLTTILSTSFISTRCYHKLSYFICLFQRSMLTLTTVDTPIIYSAHLHFISLWEMFIKYTTIVPLQVSAFRECSRQRNDNTLSRISNLFIYTTIYNCRRGQLLAATERHPEPSRDMATDTQSHGATQLYPAPFNMTTTIKFGDIKWVCVFLKSSPLLDIHFSSISAIPSPLFPSAKVSRTK